MFCAFNAGLSPASSFLQCQKNVLGGATAAKCQRPAASTLKMTLLNHEELDILFDGGDFKTAKYRLECRIEGDKSKEARRDSIRSIKQNARFDGFRKGTIPPFVLSQVNEFVLRDCISDELTAACESLGLQHADGDASDPDVDFKEVLSRFEPGKAVEFTVEVPLKSSFAAAVDAETDSASKVIDVEA